MAPKRGAAAAAAGGGGDYSNSESESRLSDTRNHNAATTTTGAGTSGNSTSRASAKARSLAIQQAQKEFLSRHINSNGPQDEEVKDPLNFENFKDSELRNYSNLYLNDYKEVKPCLTLNGYLLESKIGEKTYSYLNKNRISKPELAGVCKKHFNNLNVKETEVITNFIYKVNNQDKAFKLKFNNNNNLQNPTIAAAAATTTTTQQATPNNNNV